MSANIKLTNSKCCLVNSRDGVGESSSSTTAELPFHRHCQATILAAHGTQDSVGASWGDLVKDSQPLTNLPTNWESYFAKNTNNITQDIRSILELINAIQGNGQVHNFTISFLDTQGRVKASKRLNLGADENDLDYQIKIGGDVEITLNSENTISFNALGESVNEVSCDLVPHNLNLNIGGTNVSSVPMIVGKDDDGEYGDRTITLPTKTLTFYKNGTSIGELSVVTTDDDGTTIDLGSSSDQDCCLIPCTQIDVVGEREITLKPSSESYVYRTKLLTSISVIFDFSEYSSIRNDIISFEWHVCNYGGTDCNLTIQNNGGWNLRKLDNTSMTVEANKVNVYVFRLDTYTMSLVYKLDYTYTLKSV